MFIAASTRIAASVAFMLCMFAGVASAQQVEVLWLGHATFRITSTTGKVIVIDPFLKKNPRTPAKYKDLAAVGKVDLILVTHGHPDHVSDLGELATLTGATVVANYELANNLVALGVLDATKTIGMNKGGTVAPLGSVTTPATVPVDVDCAHAGRTAPTQTSSRRTRASFTLRMCISFLPTERLTRIFFDIENGSRCTVMNIEY